MARKPSFTSSALVLACNILILGAAPALAQETSSPTIYEASAIMERLGYSPTVEEKGSDDAPTISGIIPQDDSSISFTVKAFDCSGTPPRCKTFVVVATCAVPDALSDNSLKRINSYNDSYTKGRAFAAEGYVGVDYNVIADGSDAAGNLERRLAEFPAVVSTFVANF
jgi:hypothetical protein